MLFGNFGVRNATRHKQSKVAFTQGKDKRDVVLCKLIMKSDPVFTFTVI